MEIRILKPTTPRKRYAPHKYFAIEETITPSQRHAGLLQPAQPERTTEE